MSTRRGFLIGLLGAIATSCAARRSSVSTVDARSSTSPTTTTPTRSTAPPAVGPNPAVRPTSATSLPDPQERPAVDGPATVGEQAVRIDPPGPRGAYDREALYVALYGFPGSRTLGCLGEQGAEAGVRRAFDVARPYESFGRRVVPTFEILASVASSVPGLDGDYSNEFPVERFRPHLDAAEASGMHVVFDLQTGRARFPDQAREYEALWQLPHTSIALDPEWRVGPTQRPGGGLIGTVDATEVNETIDYIDDLIRRHDLPPKMCIVHQFTPSMITNKASIRGTDRVQVLIQMDGFGSLDLKRSSWSRTVADLPDGAFAGWKNFYDEDRPTPTPTQTMANEPTPRYVSYQ